MKNQSAFLIVDSGLKASSHFGMGSYRDLMGSSFKVSVPTRTRNCADHSKFGRLTDVNFTAMSGQSPRPTNSKQCTMNMIKALSIHILPFYILLSSCIRSLEAIFQEGI